MIMASEHWIEGHLTGSNAIKQFAVTLHFVTLKIQVLNNFTLQFTLNWNSVHGTINIFLLSFSALKNHSNEIFKIYFFGQKSHFAK